MALILSIARKIPEACTNQRERHWRGMISELGQREDELAGKTLLIYGMGSIGERLAHLARAFDMVVIGFKRNPSRHGGVANAVYGAGEFSTWLSKADFVALTCPLTNETRNLIDARALEAMRPTSHLVNVARGGCVDTDALVDALQNGSIAGAGIDVTEPEPLPAESILWGLPNVLITPHTAGETRHYEDNVISILQANLERLWDARGDLINGIF